jgi:hypothetical protein
VAEVLLGLPHVTALHDRRIPGTKTNIDHVVVGPAGVFVVDAKHYTGAVERRSHDRLFVANRNRTKLVLSMGRQVEVTRSALHRGGLGDVNVSGVLCFVGCSWPVFRPLHVLGSTALWPDALADLVATAGPLDAGRIEAVAGVLRRELPAAA